MPADKALSRLAGRGNLLHNSIVSADLDRRDLPAAVRVKADGAKVIRQLDIAGKILSDKRHVAAVDNIVCIDVGFGEVDGGLRLLIPCNVLLHQIDVRHIHGFVSVGVSIQDIVLSKGRQGARRKHGKQDTEDQYQAYNPFLHPCVPPSKVYTRLFRCFF